MSITACHTIPHSHSPPEIICVPSYSHIGQRSSPKAPAPRQSPPVAIMDADNEGGGESAEPEEEEHCTPAVKKRNRRNRKLKGAAPVAPAVAKTKRAASENTKLAAKAKANTKNKAKAKAAAGNSGDKGTGKMTCMGCGKQFSKAQMANKRYCFI